VGRRGAVTRRWLAIRRLPAVLPGRRRLLPVGGILARRRLLSIRSILRRRLLSVRRVLGRRVRLIGVLPRLASLAWRGRLVLARRWRARSCLVAVVRLLLVRCLSRRSLARSLARGWVLPVRRTRVRRLVPSRGRGARRWGTVALLGLLAVVGWLRTHGVV
jgi:hypothetical protein